MLCSRRLVMADDEGRRGGRRRRGGEAGAGQVALGAQHGGQVPGLVGVEQGQQLAGGGGVTEFVGSAGGQRPRPPQGIRADPEGAGVFEGAAGVAQRVRWLAAGGGGEGFHDADHRLVLGIFAGPQVPQRRQHGLGGRRRRRAAPPASPVAGEVLDVAPARRSPRPG